MLSIACWVCYNCFKHLTSQRVAFGSERLLFVPKTDHHHPKNNNNPKSFFFLQFLAYLSHLHASDQQKQILVIVKDNLCKYKM